MKQISEKCMMVLVCMMLAGCGSKTEMYLEQSGTEVFEDGQPGEEESGSFAPAGNTGEGNEISGQAKQEQNVSGKHAGTQQNDSSGKIAVYVCGEVKNPGVYELTGGMRICDAIEAAGGFTKQAGREYWNLAQPVTDGQMLCVPTEAEAGRRKAEAGDLQQIPSAGSGNRDSSNSGKTDIPVNINTADAALLTSVPGIGQVRAEAVIAYRQEHGNFQSIEDIKKVSGIGEALFSKMKDHITVS